MNVNDRIKGKGVETECKREIKRRKKSTLNVRGILKEERSGD